MILYFSQPGYAQKWRPILRKLFAPILANYKSKGLVTKVFFYQHIDNSRGHFRSYLDHGLYEREIKLFNSPPAIITLKISEATPLERIFFVMAHEFEHWKQSCKRKKYSEKRANKFANKMTKKHFSK